MLTESAGSKDGCWKGRNPEGRPQRRLEGVMERVERRAGG